MVAVKRKIVIDADNENEKHEVNRSLTHQFFLLDQLATELFKKEAEKAELKITPRQYAILATLYNAGHALRQVDIGNLTGIDRSTTSEVLCRMEKQGLLRRRRYRDDGRSKYIELSAAGSRLVEASKPIAKNVDAKLYDIIPYRDRISFISGTSSLLAYEEPVEDHVS